MSEKKHNFKLPDVLWFLYQPILRFTSSLFMMACISYDQETALNMLQCLRELLAEVPNFFSDFDRNLFSINNEHILQSMEIRAAELCSILSIHHADLAGLNIRGSIQIFGELRNALYELSVNFVRLHTDIESNFKNLSNGHLCMGMSMLGLSFIWRKIFQQAREDRKYISRENRCLL